MSSEMRIHSPQSFFREYQLSQHLYENNSSSSNLPSLWAWSFLLQACTTPPSDHSGKEISFLPLDDFNSLPSSNPVYQKTKQAQFCKQISSSNCQTKLSCQSLADRALENHPSRSRKGMICKLWSPEEMPMESSTERTSLLSWEKQVAPRWG